MIDGQSYHIFQSRLGPPELKNGLVAAGYAIDRDLAARIERANRLGITFQWSYEAPTFLGFDGMEVAEGRGKLSGFISSCH